MRSLNSNTLVPVAGAVIIAVFSLLLYFDMKGGRTSSQSEEIGTIVFKRQTAQRKYAEQVVWDDLAQSVPVYNYDTIRTADMSEAVIKLKDGTEIALNENSMILLVMSSDDASVEFMRGSIAANRDDTGRKLNITAGGAVVSLGEGALNLARGRGEGLDVTLNRGSALVKSGESEKEVATDQRIVVAGDVRVFDLKIRLAAPGPNEYFFTPAGKAAIVFSWEPALREGQAWLETATDPSFAALTATRAVSGKTATLARPGGIAYWRVRTADRTTGKVEVSESRRLVVLKNEPLVPITPPDGAVVRYTMSVPIILFRWSENSAGERPPFRSTATRKWKRRSNRSALRVAPSPSTAWPSGPISGASNEPSTPAANRTPRQARRVALSSTEATRRWRRSSSIPPRGPRSTVSRSSANRRPSAGRRTPNTPLRAWRSPGTVLLQA